MVLFLLYIKAEFENIGSISLRKDSNLCVSVRNPLSDFETREKVVFNPSETVDQDEGARQSPHHLSIKWEGNKKACILECLDENAAKTALKKKKSKDTPRDLTEDDSGRWVPVLAMECRGLEPYAFHSMGGEFVVTSQGGKVFTEDVDLGEGDWAEYDEENDAAVSLSAIEFKIDSV
jgi:Eukaryotic protein of unknown function (DUF866)